LKSPRQIQTTGSQGKVQLHFVFPRLTFVIQYSSSTSMGRKAGLQHQYRALTDFAIKLIQRGD